MSVNDFCIWAGSISLDAMVTHYRIANDYRVFSVSRKTARGEGNPDTRPSPHRSRCQKLGQHWRHSTFQEIVLGNKRPRQPCIQPVRFFPSTFRFKLPLLAHVVADYLGCIRLCSTNPAYTGPGVCSIGSGSDLFCNLGNLALGTQALYLEDGDLSIDNNHTERSLRGIAIGVSDLGLGYVKH
jgi:hypothetical protein